MFSFTPSVKMASSVVGVLAMLAVAGCGGQDAAIETSIGSDDESVQSPVFVDIPEEEEEADEATPEAEVEPTPEPEPTLEPEATPELEPTATAEPTPEPEPERAVPTGWQDFNLGEYEIAVPAGWDAFTTTEQIDNVLDVVDDGTTDTVPPELLQQFRLLISQGNAIVAVGTEGDNLNAFRQRGSGILVANPDDVASQTAEQLSTFAEDPLVETQARTFGEIDGLLTTGNYSIQGQAVNLYQFATEKEGFLYYATITLFSGPDEDLASEIFSSMNFTS